MVNVSSLCDIWIRWKLNSPIFASTILRYTIILKHFSYVNKLSMLSYGLRYPISNLCRAVIPYSVMRYHYFDNCAHDLRQKNNNFRIYSNELHTDSDEFNDPSLNYLYHLSMSQMSKLLWYSYFSIQSTTNRCLIYNLASVRTLREFCRRFKNMISMKSNMR